MNGAFSSLLHGERLHANLQEAISRCLQSKECCGLHIRREMYVLIHEHCWTYSTLQRHSYDLGVVPFSVAHEQCHMIDRIRPKHRVERAGAHVDFFDVLIKFGYSLPCCAEIRAIEAGECLHLFREGSIGPDSVHPLRTIIV